MSNIWKLFKGDLRRSIRNVAVMIILLGLVLLPSLFTWFNTLACWDVFGNTGNLMVAVASDDEGYKSDIVPVEINLGDQVISDLRANDEMNWVFTDSEDAIDGASSGKYFAAVVIPESFSKDMMTFYSDDVEHASIVYYSNEKKNAIASKLVGQGADQVSEEVNRIFTEKLSESALGIMSSLSDYIDEPEFQDRIGDLAAHMQNLAGQMSSGADLVRSYSSLVGSSKDLVESSTSLMQKAQSGAHDAADTLGQIEGSTSSIADALTQSSSALMTAIDQAASGFDAISQSVDTAFDSAGTVASDSSSQLRSIATDVRAQATSFSTIASDLEKIAGATQDASAQAAFRVAIAELQSSAESLERLATSLETSADQIDAGTADVAAKRQEAKDLVASAKQTVQDAKTEYENELKPQLDDLVQNVEVLESSLVQSVSTLDTATSALTGTSDSVSEKLENLQSKLEQAAGKLDSAGTSIGEFAQSVQDALESDDVDLLKTVLSTDTTSLAASLSAPVELDRHAMFEVENFGSGMSPLYTSLALWVGSLLIMVALKVNPSERTLEELDNPKLPQIFVGRFGIVALLSLAQSTFLALGNMFFLGVQVSDPLLYLLCLWVTGLVFAFIVYTLVAALANLGKAIGVIVLILQVTGSGASFPLQLFPGFFQAVSPFLPATHAVSAMRAAMFGQYMGDFWVHLGHLLLFVVPFAIIGLVLRNPFMKLVDFFVNRIEESKIA